MFCSKDSQTVRAVNTNTDTESNDGCMNYIVKCCLVEVQTVHANYDTNWHGNHDTHFEKNNSENKKKVWCILSLLLGQRELGKIGK